MVQWRMRASYAFQSLLHQGISLLHCDGASNRMLPAEVSIPSSSGHQFTAPMHQAEETHDLFRFNPFFIRASVYCSRGWPGHPLRLERVSIPSSSGHQFTEYHMQDGSWFIWNPFQSLLHQGISLLLMMHRRGAP